MSASCQAASHRAHTTYSPEPVASRVPSRSRVMSCPHKVVISSPSLRLP